MKFKCENCGTRYTIADAKIHRKVLKIRCKICEHVIVVRDPSVGTPAPQRVAGIFDGDESPREEAPTALSPSVRGQTEVEWYAAVNGEQRGPMPYERLRDMIRAGELDPEDVVWNETMGDWAEVRALAPLAELLPTAAPPPPPAAPALAPPQPPAPPPEPVEEQPPTREISSVSPPSPTMDAPTQVAPPEPEAFGASGFGIDLLSDPPKAAAPEPAAAPSSKPLFDDLFGPTVVSDDGPGDEDGDTLLMPGLDEPDPEPMAPMPAMPDFPDIPEVPAPPTSMGAPSFSPAPITAVAPPASEGGKNRTLVILALLVLGIGIGVGVTLALSGNEPSATVANATPAAPPTPAATAEPTPAPKPEPKPAPVAEKPTPAPDAAVAETPTPVPDAAVAAAKPKPKSKRKRRKPRRDKAKPVAKAKVGSVYGGLDDGKGETAVARMGGDVGENLPDTLSQGQIKSVIKRQSRGVTRCYDRQLKRDDSLRSAKVMLEFEIQPNGRTATVKLGRRFDGTVLKTCLSGLVRRWRFPRFGGAPIPVRYPLVFQASN